MGRMKRIVGVWAGSLFCLALCPCLQAQQRACWAGGLLSAYEAMASDPDREHQARFFSAFPDTGEQYELLFGYHPCLGDSSLYDRSFGMVRAFWALSAVPDSVFCDKAVAVTCGLRYEPDAPNEWQECLTARLLEHSKRSEMLIDRVALLGRGHQMQFWGFVWSAIVDVDGRGRRDFCREYIRERHPQMTGIYDCARALFYDGINFSIITPRNCPE